MTRACFSSGFSNESALNSIVFKPAVLTRLTTFEVFIKQILSAWICNKMIKTYFFIYIVVQVRFLNSISAYFWISPHKKGCRESSFAVSFYKKLNSNKTHLLTRSFNFLLDSVQEKFIYKKYLSCPKRPGPNWDTNEADNDEASAASCPDSGGWVLRGHLRVRRDLYCR